MDVVPISIGPANISFWWHPDVKCHQKWGNQCGMSERKPSNLFGGVVQKQWKREPYTHLSLWGLNKKGVALADPAGERGLVVLSPWGTCSLSANRKMKTYAFQGGRYVPAATDPVSPHVAVPSAQAAVTRCHRLGGINNRNLPRGLRLHVQNQHVIRPVVREQLAQAPLLALQMVISTFKWPPPCGSACVHVSPVDRDTSHVGSGPNIGLMT